MSAKTRYPIPATRVRVEEEIQRSRFITTLAPAPSLASAQALIAEIRAEFPDATHNCWAYLVGPPASSARVGFSDDGEPHGTAGRPMLTQLSHCGMGDLACVVTRYYGGTKLGTGGLVRAYGNGVRLAVEAVARCEKVLYRRFELVLGYSDVGLFKRLAESWDLRIESETYQLDAEFRVAVPSDRADEWSLALQQATQGGALLCEIEGEPLG